MLNKFDEPLLFTPLLVVHRGYSIYIHAAHAVIGDLIRHVVDRILHDFEKPGLIKYFSFHSLDSVRIRLKGIPVEQELKAEYLDRFFFIARAVLAIHKSPKGLVSYEFVERTEKEWLEDFGAPDAKKTVEQIERVLFPEGMDKPCEAGADEIGDIANILLTNRPRG